MLAFDACPAKCTMAGACYNPTLYPAHTLVRMPCLLPPPAPHLLTSLSILLPIYPPFASPPHLVEVLALLLGQLLGPLQRLHTPRHTSSTRRRT